jgi:glycosyltransferase involved in cell wall biosynthesis
MRILYVSCHAILEHDEVKLFTEMGHDVFSIGAYSNGGKGHYLLPRPAIEGMQEYPELEIMARNNPRTNLPKELFDQFDVILWMHQPDALNENWEKMKHKKVIFRSIGQNTQHVENMIRHMRYEGLKVVRMSPMEERITGYVGGDATIRFYKDENEWLGWNGNEKRAINMTQSLLGRRVFCHYDSIMATMRDFPALVIGSGNDDLGAMNGGDLPYELMKGALRDNRCFVYGGTWPSPYTLAFQEAMMTGIPMVCIGKKLAEDLPEIARNDQIDYYEIPDMIVTGQSGFLSDDINELRDYVHQLLEDQNLAKRIGDAGRETAIQLFGKEKIRGEWEAFFTTL